MKKKIFSALLLVVFAFAATSTVVSCKDYEDDINANANDIKSLKDQYSTLQGALTAAQSAAQAADAAAKAAQKTADDAVKAADSADKAAQAADEVAKAAKALAEAAATAEKVNQIEKALGDLEKLMTGKVSQEDYDKAMAKLAGDIDGIDQKLNELTKGLLSEEDVKKISDAAAQKAGEEAVAAVTSNLQSQLDVLNAFKKSIDDMKLPELIAELRSTFEKYEGNFEKIEKRLAELEKLPETVEANRKNIETLQGTVSTIQETLDKKANSADVTTEIAAAIEGLKGIMETADNAINTNLGLLTTRVETLEKFFANYSDEGAGVDLKAIVDRLNKIDQSLAGQTTTNEGVSNSVKAINGALEVLNAYISRSLTSIVLAPDFYWGGIEAIEAAQVCYDVWGIDNAEDKKFDPKKVGSFEWWKLTNPFGDKKDEDKNTYTPAIIATYHVNPGTFDVSKVKAWNVIYADKRAYTRGSVTLDPKVEAVTQSGDSAFVQISLNYNAIKGGFNINNAPIEPKKKDISDFVPGEVTVLAVQAIMGTDEAGKDSTVTSDYAAVAPAIIGGFEIADIGVDLEANPSYNEESELDPDDCDYSGNLFKLTNRVHIYETMKDAVESPYTHALVWNDAEGIDLNDFIKVHAYHSLTLSLEQMLAEGETNAMEIELTPKELERYGLSLKYTALSYVTGGQATEQTSTHSVLNGSVITPKSIGEGFNMSSLGREPLIRVELINKDGNTIRVGYVKFRIVKEAQHNTVQEFELIKDKKFFWNCLGGQIKTTWTEVEEKILYAVGEQGIGKDDFESQYGLVVDKDGNTESIQSTTEVTAQIFVKDAKGKYVPAEYYFGADSLGVIKYNNVADPNGDHTGYFTWTFEESNMQAALQKYKVGKDKEGNDVWVKDEGQFADSKTLDVAVKLTNGSNDVYVTFNATIEKLKAQINHMKNHWYAKDSKEIGDYEVHMNVDPAYQTAAVISHFESDLKMVFAGQDLTQAGNDPSVHAYTFKNTITKKDVTPDGKELTKSIYGKNKVTTYLRFVVTTTAAKKQDGSDMALTEKNGVAVADTRKGQSGKVYLLIAPDDKTLSAYEYNAKDKKAVGAAQEVMKLNGTKLVLQETAYAKDMLNVASHSDLANSLLVNIGLRADFSACPIEILPEIIVPVKVLRPLDAVGDNTYAFTDAKTDGNILKVAELLKKGFKDWRKEWIVDATHNFYTYYDVKTVKVDLDNMTTDLQGKDINKDKLKDVAPETFKFFSTATSGGSFNVATTSDGKPVTNKDFGIIKYDNVNNTTHPFKVKIPLTVGYYWGDVVTYVTISVAKSKEN